LDGTINYLYGQPHWCVSIACADADGAIAGAVYDPSRDELFTAVRGGGARLAGRPLAASTVGDPAIALVATGFSYDAAERAAQAAVVARLAGKVRDIRRAGSAAYGARSHGGRALDWNTHVADRCRRRDDQGAATHGAAGGR